MKDYDYKKRCSLAVFCRIKVIFYIMESLDFTRLSARFKAS